jgi:transposase
MTPRFAQCDRDTLYLMPPSIQDWLPENHLARFVVDIVSQLDVWPLENAYAGRGSDAYPPRMLLALLFYGYATGIFSSRKLEAATYDSVAFRCITANTHPDHDTIANFRKRFLEELKTLFAQILTIAHTMGVLNLGKVSLDGTKVKANASKHKALSWDHACKLEKQIHAEVDALLRQAEEADREDLPDGISIPEELARRRKRLGNPQRK